MKTKLKFEINGVPIEPPSGKWPEIKIEVSYPRNEDDDFEDDGAYADDSDEDEEPIWACTGCGWSAINRPMGGECPKCMNQCEEEYL